MLPYKIIPTIVAALVFMRNPEARSVHWINFAYYVVIPLFFVGVIWANSIVCRFENSLRSWKEALSLADFAKSKRDLFIIDMILILALCLIPRVIDKDAVASPYFVAVFSFSLAQCVMSYIGMFMFSRFVYTFVESEDQKR